MTLLAKIITTLIILLISFLIGSLNHGNLATPLIGGAVVSILVIWSIKNPNKKELTDQQKKTKKNRDVIVILGIIALIVILLILKQAGVLN